MNNKWSFSKYILAIRDESNNLILYNTLFSTSVFISECDIDVFMRLYYNIEQGKINESNESIMLLRQKKMLLADDESRQKERNLLHERYKSVIENDKTLNLIILPTEKCNFRCIYCYENFSNGKMDQVIVGKIQELIKENLNYFKQLHISWFGGEPLLAFDIIKKISRYAIQTCKEMKKPYSSYITTNGYYLTTDVAKELIKLHVTKFQITIDGGRNTHNKKRKLKNGEGTFDTILRNLLDIKNNIKTNTIKFIIRINITDENSLDEINEIQAYFYGDKRFVFNLQPVFGSIANEQMNSDSNVKYNELLKDCENNELGELSAEDQICYAAKHNTLMIRSNGDLGRCTVNFDDPNNCFGNIGLYNWTNTKLDTFHYNNSQHKYYECINCCLFPLCFGMQCPARRKQACEKIYRKCVAILKTIPCDDQRLIMKLED